MLGLRPSSQLLVSREFLQEGRVDLRDDHPCFQHIDQRFWQSTEVLALVDGARGSVVRGRLAAINSA
jgi:hypothetical protein